MSKSKNVARMDFSCNPEEYTPPPSHVDLRSAKRESIDHYVFILPENLEETRRNRANELIRELESNGYTVEIKLP